MANIAMDFDDWYSSTEFKVLLANATKASYHDTYTNFLVWEKETRELVNRVYKRKNKEVSKLDVWKKVVKEFGFAEQWEHRLSDNLSVSHPDIFSMGLKDESEPDIVNLQSSMHGLEFKTRVNTIQWSKPNNNFIAVKPAPKWSKKSEFGTKLWYPWTVVAWRNCPIIYKDDKISLENPDEIMFGKTSEDMLNFGENKSSSMSMKVLVEKGTCVSIYKQAKAQYPKWYRK